jgi:glyoxylase-like metal-dependent hydrolase (beta-lactamase superfamily II)/ferredoxin
MASKARRLASNSAGSFYVDDSCIDCGTCRWMAPKSFDRLGEYSRVYAQPANLEEEEAALRSLIACPTASIGSADPARVREAAGWFPQGIEEEVYFCGYHAESSFGATSYLARRPEGNILVDSPRFAAPLVRRLEELGGVRWLFLTHIDDVGDHQKFAEHFGATRVMHRGDFRERVSAVEWWLEGEEPVELAPGVTMWPTPGHTAGSACLHVDETYLFTGDTLAWQREWAHLYAFRRACWQDWGILRESIQRLQPLAFRWVLPGHSSPVELPAGSSGAAIERCLAWMATVP